MDRSRLQQLHDMPDWAAALVFTCLLLLTIAGAVMSILLVLHLTAGPYHPPPNCGTTGIYKVLPQTDEASLTIVCNNGTTYYP